MVRGEVEWKCVEVGEVEIFLDEVEKKMVEGWRRKWKEKEGKKKEKGKRKRN